MKSAEILKTFIDFYVAKNHKQVPNVSLVPQGDSTLLYVNSGMFPLVPYLLGEPHPLGTRLVNFQRCLRFFEDLDNVGETLRHTTAFHMFGNWSLNDYFKNDQLPWVFELFIDKMGMDPERIYSTVFMGNEFAEKDTESIEILKSIYLKYGIDAKEGEQIFALGNSNWWKRGDAPGELGGPSSEIFYYLGNGGSNGKGLGLNLEVEEDAFLEIGNSVFMQYKKNNTGGWDKIDKHNIDFGGGLERVALVLQGKQDIFETDNFWPIIEELQKITGIEYDASPLQKKAMRVIADHIRSSVLLAMDGVIPSNKDQGYLLRRLIRRMVRYGRKLNLTKEISARIVPITTEMLKWAYPELPAKNDEIQNIFNAEEEKFQKVIDRETPRIIKSINLSKNNPDFYYSGAAKIAFDFFQSAGYPLDFFIEDLKENSDTPIDEKSLTAEYDKIFASHQELSRAGAEKKFKGGLADHSEETTKYHTATHLILAGLRKVLGDSIIQKGSNITNERLRFDFPFERVLTDAEIKTVEQFVNSTIASKLPVNSVALPKEEAEKTGAMHVFGEKYGDVVTVYFIGETLETAVSKEFCGGPHVKNISEIGRLSIYKQESVGKGVRRVYAKSV